MSKVHVRNFVWKPVEAENEETGKANADASPAESVK
jgi:hypothetical protein